MSRLSRLCKWLTFWVLLIYIAFCVTVYLKPQWFFYNPSRQASKLENAHANGFKAEFVKYNSEDGTPLYGWLTKPASKKQIIVFMHGNSYNIEKFYHKMIPLMEAGYGTMMPEYRGFGDVPGIITEQNLAQDALAAVKFLNSQGYPNQDIIIYGMSLGSFMATNTVYVLGQRQPFAGLILEVPFDNLVNVVKAVVPVPLPLKFMMKDRYNNLDKIAEIKTPLLVMGGTEDPTVPVFLAKNLYAHAVEPKKMIIYQGGGHNDLYNFRNYEDILNWLKDNEETRP